MVFITIHLFQTFVLIVKRMEKYIIVWSVDGMALLGTLILYVKLANLDLNLLMAIVRE